MKVDAGNIIVKSAKTKKEFDQIHQLNYETFVEEIKQHKTNEAKSLVDCFNKENTYYIAKVGEELIGMIALRDRRPFSLDKKIPNLDKFLPKHKRLVEIRLLSVKKEYRNSKVLLLLLQHIIQGSPEKSYDLAVISGILNQKKLYKRMGFQEMGSLVGGETKFQPMFLTKERYLDFTSQLFKTEAEVLNLLPGPVEIAANVKEAFCKDPVSHRSSTFISIFNRVKSNLLKLTSAKYVAILTGTGTTANDAVAGQIRDLDEKGLIITNGEFGERLCKHADNFRINYKILKKEWGDVFSREEIERELADKDIKWLWFAHHETSTGMINNFSEISEITQKFDVKLCVDVISSLGTQRLDLSTVYLASAVSSKGLSSYAGLSIIFYNNSLADKKQIIPSNINLSIFERSNGVPFTLSSNTIMALDQSLQNFDDFENRLNNIKYVTDRLRKDLENMGISVLVNKEESSSSTMTIILNKNISSVELGNKLKKNNILVSFESKYLIKQNWIQVCFMGANPDYNKTKVILDFLA